MLSDISPSLRATHLLAFGGVPETLGEDQSTVAENKEEITMRNLYQIVITMIKPQ